MIAFTYDDEKKDQAAFLIQKDGTISVEKVQNDVEDMLQRNIGIKSHRRGVPIMKVTGIEGGRGLRGEGGMFISLNSNAKNLESSKSTVTSLGYVKLGVDTLQINVSTHWQGKQDWMCLCAWNFKPF